MLTRTQYLKLCVLLPLVAAPIWGAVALSAAVIPYPEWLGYAITVGWMGPFLFGIPYAVIAAVAVLLLRGRSWRRHVLTAVAAPWFMLFAIVSISLLQAERDVAGYLRTFGPTCLIAGYFYVAVAFAGWRMLWRRGWLADERPAN